MKYQVKYQARKLNIFTCENKSLFTLRWGIPGRWGCNGFLLLTLLWMMQSHRQSEFCANFMHHESDPGQAGYLTLKRLHGKFWPRLRGYPGLIDRATVLGWSPHLSCKRDQIKMRDYMDRRVTQPKRVTSPTWGPPPPCKHVIFTCESITVAMAS